VNSKKRKLPPDPEGLNDDRAEWAHAALEAFKTETRTDEGDVLCDLLADLGHWCDRNGYQFQEQLRRAISHYEAETEDDDGDTQGEQFTDITLRAF
jgi:hypothetical protein